MNYKNKKIFALLAGLTIIVCVYGMSKDERTIEELYKVVADYKAKTSELEVAKKELNDLRAEKDMRRKKDPYKKLLSNHPLMQNINKYERKVKNITEERARLHESYENLRQQWELMRTEPMLNRLQEKQFDIGHLISLRREQELSKKREAERTMLILSLKEELEEVEAQLKYYEEQEKQYPHVNFGLSKKPLITKQQELKQELEKLSPSN